jgi:hypothetical protein
MNHRKIYDNIILKAKSENRQRHQGTYYENHHINPKCLGGNNDKENLVLLTAREHYICHKLLTYIYNGNPELVYAFFRMTFNKNVKHHLTSRDYMYAKELRSITPMSKEQKEKLSESHKGKISFFKGKTYEEIYGKEKSKKLKQNSSKSRLGKISLKRGTTLTKQQIEKIIHTLTGKKQSKETIDKRVKKIKGLKRKRIICVYCSQDFSVSTHNRWHGENCKQKLPSRE